MEEMGWCQITNQVKSDKKKKHMEITISKCELLVSCIEKAWRRPKFKTFFSSHGTFQACYVTVNIGQQRFKVINLPWKEEEEEKKKNKGNI